MLSSFLTVFRTEGSLLSCVDNAQGVVHDCVVGGTTVVGFLNFFYRFFIVVIFL